MTFREAGRADVPVILSLLADDDVSRARGGAVSEAADAAHWAAFEAIDADPHNELIVALDGDQIVGTFQLTFTPSLSRGGATRMTIEAVRVRSDRRGGGLGREMMAWALDRGRARGARMAQLTSDNKRLAAHRFYAALGFESTHVGMKRPL
ncbi:GNAT family N-acetyltransferase [Actinoplanes sp. NPDC049265]|uniref:GNAT family N-acetyltransferase n=1 Tax=Actinoplanes sp. NPDC049265 TaxID=3363902 RepID=UPI0037217EB5